MSSPRRQPARSSPARPNGAWKSVWFQCCHQYGRIYRNAAHTRYEGHCPKCGAKVYAVIGPGGTSQRLFRAS